MLRLSRRRRQFARGERGISLIESAITLPLFLLLIFGTMETGLAIRTFMTLSNTTREATRFGSTIGRQYDADFQILSTVEANLDGFNAGDLQKVVIFRANGPESIIGQGDLAGCLDYSVANRCNLYSGPMLNIDADDYGCEPTSFDRFWCPATRKIRVSDPPDFIGVYVEVLHTGITGGWPITRVFHESVIMRIEPTRT